MTGDVPLHVGLLPGHPAMTNGYLHLDIIDSALRVSRSSAAGSREGGIPRRGCIFRYKRSSSEVTLKPGRWPTNVYVFLN
ncbi:hypothetical protein C9J85_05785 [Haloferax sp. wsp5]|nr:hypothetical protein C9J85_05785 [Haloferax sp. wsp5]